MRAIIVDCCILVFAGYVDYRAPAPPRCARLGFFRLFQVEVFLGFFPWPQRLGTVLGNGLFEIAQIFKVLEPLLKPRNG